MHTPDGHVDIQIDDPKKFLDVCSLLDRPDFILDVFALRKKWRITKFYPRIKNKLWQELPPFKEQVPKEKEFTKKYKTTPGVYGVDLTGQIKRLLRKAKPEAVLRYFSKSIALF